MTTPETAFSREAGGSDVTPAYKLGLLLNRRTDFEQEAFADSLLELERSAPVDVAGLLGYAVTIVEGGGFDGTGEPRYDAIIETWWTRKNNAADWIVSREFESDWLAPRLLLTADRPVAVGGSPTVSFDREVVDETSLVQLVVLPTSPRSLRFDQFVENWTQTHAQLALNGPESRANIVRIEDVPSPIAPPSRFRAARHDGVGVIVFESRGAFEKETSSGYFRERVAPDVANFSMEDHTVLLVGQPHRIV